MYNNTIHGWFFKITTSKLCHSEPLYVPKEQWEFFFKENNFLINETILKSNLFLNNTERKIN